MFQVEDHVTVIDDTDSLFGRTGKVVWVQKDGTLLVDGLRGTCTDALCGWPALRPDQLRHA